MMGTKHNQEPSSPQEQLFSATWYAELLEKDQPESQES